MATLRSILHPYAGETCEGMLGDAKWQNKSIKMQTKLYPTTGKGMNTMPSEEYSHSAADYIRAGLLKSFEALKTDKIDMFSDLIVKQTSRSQQEKLASCAKKASSGALASATSCHGK